MEDDWDLHAVVRGCAASASASASASSPPPAVGLRPLQEALPPEKQECFFSSGAPWGRFQARNASEELQQLYMPFFPKSFKSLPPQNMPFLSPPPPSPSLAGSNLSQRQRLEPLKQHQKQLHAVNSQSNRSKRRKSQMKRVCHVPAEELTSDVWAWRKYGQKPIKGSPYPRGYYRCSSSKGCLARKQVERNKTDPAMFIVTYTAEHNHPAPTHRNSLAGSTRQKPSAASAGEGDGDAADKEASKSSPCPCSPGSGVSNTTSSPLPPELVKAESSATDQEDAATAAAAAEEDEDEELGGLFSEVMDGIDDDFFMGLEELTGFVGDCFPGHSPAAFSLHWGANNAAAAAGGD